MLLHCKIYLHILFCSAHALRIASSIQKMSQCGWLSISGFSASPISDIQHIRTKGVTLSIDLSIHPSHLLCARHYARHNILEHC